MIWNRLSFFFITLVYGCELFVTLRMTEIFNKFPFFLFQMGSETKRLL